MKKLKVYQSWEAFGELIFLYMQLDLLLLLFSLVLFYGLYIGNFNNIVKKSAIVNLIQ